MRSRISSEHGSVIEATLSASVFVKSSKKLTNLVAKIPDDILEDNYRKFVKVLENHVGNKEIDALTSKDIIKDFLSTELKLYEGVEVTVQCILSAAVKISVESDVESLVSVYEKHLKIDRQMDEENAEHEMEIAENGPLLQNADKILKAAMDSYWKESTKNGLWHFVSKQGELSLTRSKVLDRLNKQCSKFGFMDK